MEPGGVWDQVLQAKVTYSRESIPTMIGEVAFHGLDEAGKDLDRVLTVVHCTERTTEAVLTALRTGHAYAVGRGDENILLRLDEFQLTAERSPRVAEIGGTLDWREGPEIMVRVGISTVDQKPHPARLRLIRSGRVIGQIAGLTPLQY